MTLKSMVSPIGALLALIHFALAVLASTQQYEGSWGYVFFAIPDLPIMLLIGGINHLLNLNSAWPLVIIFGSLWWYFLGWLFEWALKRKRLR